MKYINGVGFQEIADFIIDIDRRCYSDINKSGIIWCKTDFIEELFNHIRNSNHKYILITHNSDHSIDQRRFLLKPPCIVKWFAQNVNVENEDLIPLPIGFENDRGPSKGKWTDFDFLKEALEFLPIKDSEKFTNVYVNFTIQNNTKHRLLVFEALKNVAMNGLHVSFKEYYNLIRRFKFIASPQGNGIDCHRTWEVLYAEAIPLVDDSIHMRSLAEIYPMILIQDWNKINNIEVLLEMSKTLKPIDRISLDISYWFDVIKSVKI